MPVNIHISGETAEEVIGLMRGLAGVAPAVEVSCGPLPNAAATELAEKIAASPVRTVGDEHVHEPADYEAEPELDSAGVPFDPDLHTGTRKKDGTWRLRKGATAAAVQSEPEAPSESADDAGEETANDVEESSEDDEFAAFAQAAKEQAVEPAEVPARSWTDADIASLVKEAALKLGGAEGIGKVKEVIARWSPEGVVPHSRHIRPEDREAFAQELEKLADFEFAG